jgi:hypothetical protein
MRGARRQSPADGPLAAKREDEGMALPLAPEEPEAGPWRVESLSTVADAVTRPGPGRGKARRPAVLAVDGRSNNGKTIVAARIRKIMPGAVVVHTDDIAFEHSRFGWADLRTSRSSACLGSGFRRRHLEPLERLVIERLGHKWSQVGWHVRRRLAVAHVGRHAQALIQHRRRRSKPVEAAVQAL